MKKSLKNNQEGKKERELFHKDKIGHMWYEIAEVEILGINSWSKNGAEECGEGGKRGDLDKTKDSWRNLGKTL